VSTKAQLTNTEEIPTQKHQCNKYIENQPEWELCREITESAVSAFKNKAEDREILNTILQGAMNKEFDIVLVYKADRLGRLGVDSLSFVMKLWEQGVKVYSTIEGYLSVETVNDRIITGLHFHLSEGESTSTSQRVSDFMQMYNEDGKYMGGTPPYGFKVADTKDPHWKKRDKTVKTLCIEESEAEVVKEMFDLTYQKGYGGERIAKHLNSPSCSYKTRTGGIWRANVITRVLRNTIYIGIKRYGTVNKKGGLKSRDEFMLQPKNEEWIIVDEAVFWKVQDMMDKRLNREDRSTGQDHITASKMLFSGIAKCGYCGTTLKADYSQKKYKRVTDGEITTTVTYRYSCNTAKNNKGNHEVSYFSGIKFENEVERIVLNFIRHVDMESFKTEANKIQIDNIGKSVKEVNALRDDLSKKYRELDKLKEEVVKTLMGESQFTSELLKELIGKKEAEIKYVGKMLSESEEKATERKLEADDIESLSNELGNWEEKYATADINAKKVMMSRIIKDLQLKKDEVYIKVVLPLEKSIKHGDNSVEHN
jgi:site-specific DNA recombinase